MLSELARCRWLAVCTGPRANSSRTTEQSSIVATMIDSSTTVPPSSSLITFGCCHFNQHRMHHGRSAFQLSNSKMWETGFTWRWTSVDYTACSLLWECTYITHICVLLQNKYGRIVKRANERNYWDYYNMAICPHGKQTFSRGKQSLWICLVLGR
jgi:hypothetical protein